MADTGVELFTHNLWANLKLLDVCEKLSDPDLDATAPGTYGTVRDTLTHMLAAEGRYVAEIGAGHEIRWEEEPFPGFETLRKRAMTSGQALIEIARTSPTDRVLKGTYRGQPYEMAASVLLTQAINHATEHRSHITSILTQRGIDVSSLRTDSIAYFQAGANVR